MPVTFLTFTKPSTRIPPPSIRTFSVAFTDAQITPSAGWKNPVSALASELNTILGAAAEPSPGTANVPSPLNSNNAKPYPPEAVAIYTSAFGFTSLNTASDANEVRIFDTDLKLVPSNALTLIPPS